MVMTAACSVGVLCSLALLLTAPIHSEAANILGVFSATSPSHLIVNMAVVRALADRGHNITVVSLLKPKLKHENITSIVIPETPEQEKRKDELMGAMSKGNNSKLKMFSVLLKFTYMGLETQADFITNERLTSLYNATNTKFDLIIWGYFINEFQLGIAAKFNVPIIVNWVGIPWGFPDALVGNIRDPTYVPNMDLPIALGEVMSFFKRATNLFTDLIFRAIMLIVDQQMARTYNKIFENEGPNFPSYYESKRRISLLFNNYHEHSEGPIRPTVPQSVQIGGIQIKEQPDPLPQHIQKFLDEANAGAIFFSLGSNVKSSYIKPEIIKLIFNVLSKLQQRVIWKWEDLDNTPGVAQNILYDSWLPQDDILAHPNIKLFITHAGKGSIAEAQYYGIPMLALPIFGDQPANAQNMVTSGFGKALEILKMTESEFNDTLQEVLTNPIYVANVKKFSQLYRDRPLTARESVVFWTEYVLRHKGAYHLQSPLVRMSFIERHNLDVYAAFAIIIYLSFRLIKFIFKLLYTRIFKRKKFENHKRQSQAKKIN